MVKKIESLIDISAVHGYLTRIGAEVRSLKTAVVRENHGSYWKDIAVIRITKDGNVTAPEAYMPTDTEAAGIKAGCVSVQWPSHKLVKGKLSNIPKEVRDTKAEDVFEFRNEKNEFVMFQIRKKVRESNVDKIYLSWTLWDDGTWRRMEPEGLLPLYNLDKMHSATTAFVHEGAKAARAMQTMIERKTPDQKRKYETHPWAEELSNAVHLGWIGGALSPNRTDWSALKKAGIKRVYIVSDNDPPGVRAVPAISFHCGLPAFHIQFTNEWVGSFDLADDFPDKMFEEIDGHRYYTGPSFRSVLHPATWCTDLVPNLKGKPSIKMRDQAAEMWAYVEAADLYVNMEMPEILRTEAVLNKALSGFSHSPETSRLINKAYQGRSAKLCYRPDVIGRVVTDKTTSAINLHTPTHIKAAKGSPKMWLEYMEYMVVDPKERHELLKWCATLIARPGTKMEYGVLMVSEHQGIGKTTLGMSVLAPLVGTQNVGYPAESDITNSNFNDWVANKRLVVVNEIYSGHSWKAYNQLKGVITDKEITVNAKYQRAYIVENWAHIFACSNSMRALRMESDDRRWFYPVLTEKAWPKAKFAEFHRWLKAGGLSIIKQWADDFDDYVTPGSRAPMTMRKKELIDESKSKAERDVAALATMMMDSDKPIALAMTEIESWAAAMSKGKVFESSYELRKAMKDAGAIQFEKRIKINGRLEYILINAALRDLAKDDTDKLRDAKVPPSKVYEETI